MNIAQPSVTDKSGVTKAADSLRLVARQVDRYIGSI